MVATVSKALKEKKMSQLQALEFRKECATMLAVIVSKIQERSPLQFHFARKLQSLDPRVMVSKPESVVKMFKQVLKTVVEQKWKTNQQTDSELAQFRKLISESKKYHYERFATYSFTQERLGTSLEDDYVGHSPTLVFSRLESYTCQNLTFSFL